MRLALGSDHRGYDLKAMLTAHLQAAGHEVFDLGTHNSEPTDHPLIAFAVGEAVAHGEADLGILMCGSGLGVCIAANKVPGVAAAPAWNPDLARLSREHNGANVLCLPADFLAPWYALQIVEAFMKGLPNSAERFVRRREQVARYEQAHSTAPTADCPE
ncbi:MAG: Ribose-5-phosphate isomerase B [bacterium]|nr:Ribose-5-phosphate isomerase B [bacterium]